MALLATASATPRAQAVTPPAVDGGRLPPAGPAAPPRTSQQHESCVTATDSVPPLPPRADLKAAWSLTRGSGQTVAVIDTGVSRHRLLPHLIPGGDYVSTGDGTQDCDGHGTIIAGIIGAVADPADESGFSGIAPDASILGIRQSSNKFRAADDPGGTGFGDVDTLALAVRAAADLGATVINISSPACLPAAEPLDDRALGAALAYAVDVKNVVIVAAAGNTGGQCPQQNPTIVAGGRPDWNTVQMVVSPCWYDDYVLTAGSVGADGAPSAFTMAGPWVDVAAPGEAVVSLSATGGGLVANSPGHVEPKPISGTSYAAPVVAAITALVRSRAPQLTARQVMRRIEDTAHPPPGGWDPLLGHGVVDVLGAVSGLGPEPTPPAARRVAAPEAAAAEPDMGRVALGGAAVCVAVAAAAITMSARRRHD